MQRAAAHPPYWRQSPLRLRLNLDVFGAALAALCAGFVVTRSPLPIALLVVGAFVVLAVARVPWLPFVLITASVATFAFYAGSPEVFGIKAPELVLAAALAGSAGPVARREWRMPSIQTLLLALFLAAILSGVYVGMEHGATLDQAVKAVRPMAFYVAFWPAFVVAADPRWRMLVMRLTAVVVPVVVGIQLAQIHVGLDRPLFAFSAGVESVVLTPQPDGFLRVRPPALTLIYVVTIFAAAFLLWGPRRHRLRAAFVLGASALGVLLSLNRNMIIGIVLGLAVSAVIVPKRNRFLVAALASSVLAVASFSIWQADRRAGATGSVVQRVLSIGDVAELRSGTLSDRSYENRFAIRVLKDEPLTGIGWGTPYGARLTQVRDGRVVTEPRGFMHQQYLWIWMRTGVVGLLALIALLGLGLISAARWARKRTWDEQSWLGPAVLAAGVALAASANVGTYLTNPESIVVLVGVLALAYALREELPRKQRKAAA